MSDAYLVLGLRLDVHGVLYVHDAGIYSEGPDTITHALDKVVPVTAMEMDASPSSRRREEYRFAAAHDEILDELHRRSKTSKLWRKILEMVLLETRDLTMGIDRT